MNRHVLQVQLEIIGPINLSRQAHGHIRDDGAHLTRAQAAQDFRLA